MSLCCQKMIYFKVYLYCFVVISRFSQLLWVQTRVSCATWPYPKIMTWPLIFDKLQWLLWLIWTAWPLPAARQTATLHHRRYQLLISFSWKFYMTLLLSGISTGSDCLGASGLEALCQCLWTYSLQSPIQHWRNTNRLFRKSLPHLVPQWSCVHPELQEHNTGQFYSTRDACLLITPPA